MRNLPEQAESLPREVTGPTAIGKDLQRFWRLAWTLAATEFKLRFFGSVLGYFWQLMRPLLLFSVIYVVFVVVLGAGGGEPRFGSALLLGMVIFQFFGDATALSIRSMIENETLLRKMDFPRAAIPVSCVLQASFSFGLNLVPVALFLFITGGSVTISWLLLPVVFVLLVLLISGLALMLSAMFVSFRDVEPIWEVITQALFYVTPIIYSLSIVIDKIGESAARLMLINPLASAIQQLRHSVIDPAYVSPIEVFGSTAGLAIPVLLCVIVFAAGVLVFRSATKGIAELL